MADFYDNPALAQEELNRTGTLNPSEGLSTSKIMDSVFFNIQNNTAKIMSSNSEGEQQDARAEGNLLQPEDVWKEYGVKTEKPISEANALRIRDNMDEVAEKNYNVATLDHTSLNQARVFLNATGGAIITDPVNWALAAFTGGLGLIAKSIVTSSRILSAASSVATSTGLRRVVGASILGATENFIEGVIESEILIDQAPKAGIKFDDEDYLNNVRAQTLLGFITGGIRQGVKEIGGVKPETTGSRSVEGEVVEDGPSRIENTGSKPYGDPIEAEFSRVNKVSSKDLVVVDKDVDLFRRMNESKDLVRAYSEVSADVLSPLNRRKKFTTTNTDISTDLSPSGKYYTTHFSNGKLDLSTQSPVSNSNFGKGYQFSSSKKWAYSDKKLGSKFKESRFEVDPSELKLKLYDAESPLNRDLNERVYFLIQSEIGWLPNAILKQMKDGKMESKYLAEVLTSFDAKTGTKTIEALTSVLQTDGFHGFSFKESEIGGNGEALRGMHLFDMPEELSFNRMVDDVPTSPKDVDTQGQLDFYSNPENKVSYRPEVQKSLDLYTKDLPPSDVKEEFKSNVVELESLRTNIAEEMEYMVDEMKDLLADSKEVLRDLELDPKNKIALEEVGDIAEDLAHLKEVYRRALKASDSAKDSIDPDMARSIAKILDFCGRR